MVVKNSKNETFLVISKQKDEKTFAMCVSLLLAKENRIFNHIMSKCITLVRKDAPELPYHYIYSTRDAILVYATTERLKKENLSDVMKEKCQKEYKSDENRVIVIDDKIDDLLDDDFDEEVEEEEVSEVDEVQKELMPDYIAYMGNIERLTPFTNKMRYYYAPLLGELLDISVEAKVYKTKNGYLVETPYELGETYTETTDDYPEKEFIMNIGKNGEWERRD